MARPIIDFKNERRGAGIVKRQIRERRWGAVCWSVRCDCGKSYIAESQTLKKRKDFACRECLARAQIKHGHARTDDHHYLYSTWEGMKRRCLDPKATGYEYYGGRGIGVFLAWEFSFEAFEIWIRENLGQRPEGHTLDRIDNDGDYRPGNLRWATAAQQNSTKRR